ncbi:glycine cleavage T-protein C-terminal barrel domain protein [Asticcacaulis biprosthecium C19]|uniref:Glycine cleavage T-protein C-terminal barrel domain protein n=1 Tax=Asticcacaulis biprosthecium C19 TaxID=715226 RepID=F4QPP6_9CAUL|nr:folate-binding protein YgfZ [Asticcacaulis biprosthecium]EGF90183.1 glycine cleavage T-protein C-terminal barrel domain protein [Asticcacaulis biprosthecium C19]
MYADCLLSPRSADEVWLDVPQTAREELVAKLNMYRLRAKVTIDALDLPVYAAFDGPMPEGFASDPRSEVIGADFSFAYGPQTPNATDWAAFRYSYGLAEAGTDFAKDELYAIDANLDLLNGIDFKKGCYVGQELTSRMKRRGQIKNRILPLRHAGHLPPGAEVLNGERRAGEVLASIDGNSLALMRLDRLDGELTCDGHTLNLTIPDWIAPHISMEAA